MGIPDPDQMAPPGEAAVSPHGGGEPEPQSSKAHPFSSLGRQSSIYSLTLDEFQHALCESGKNFGSMNMDEFLSSIWTAEENQAINSGVGGDRNNDGNAGYHNRHVSDEVSSGKGIAKQHSLTRQGSLSLPDALCRKTVDEVWSEIHKSQQSGQQVSNVQNHESAARQPTFGEMTLEDFLIKAGVVREQCAPPAPPQQQQQYGVYQNSNSAIGTGFIPQPITGTGGLGGGPGGAYQVMPPRAGGMMGEASGYGGEKRSGAYKSMPPPVCYAPVVGNGGGGSGNGYGPAHPMGMARPVSPISSDGMGLGSVDGSGLDMPGMRAGKRIVDGPVDKVVERRQRRMIKNRESAARSRARKQAYTVELEAELNQLREENAHLKQAVAELERKRKQQHLEELRLNTQTRSNRPRERPRMMQRNLSCPL